MKRFLLASLGVFFVVLGGVGIWLPLIPTVGPLLVASFCFAKSFPALEKRLIRNRLFSRFHRFLDGDEAMSMKTRLLTIATMWLSIVLSGIAIWYSSPIPVAGVIVMGILGMTGTIVIWRFRRTDKSGCDGSDPIAGSEDSPEQNGGSFVKEDCEERMDENKS